VTNPISSLIFIDVTLPSVSSSQLPCNIDNGIQAGHLWLIPVILAFGEAEIRSIAI
jgi:hypothetical protein